VLLDLGAHADTRIDRISHLASLVVDVRSPRRRRVHRRVRARRKLLSRASGESKEIEGIFALDSAARLGRQIKSVKL
jgi:hypothetical protein